MKREIKKLTLPFVLLIGCFSIVLLLPPVNQIAIAAMISCLLIGIFLLLKFFFPIKYAYLSCFFLGIGLLLGFIKILDPINALLLVSLFVGSIILIK